MVLQPKNFIFRQMIQQEFVYIINENSNLNQDEYGSLCYRSKDKFNRFIFEFPPEWRTSSIKERVIGFRSLWISEEYRYLTFNLDINIEGENYFSVPIESWINEENDLRKLWHDIKRCVEKYITKYNKNFDIDNLKMNFDYKNGTFNNVLFTTDPSITIRVSDLNDDAKAVLNMDDSPDEFEVEIRFENIWVRKPCCLKASFSVSNGDNYLGYSNKSYEPIKYFKINCNETNFYIDLFHPHNHNIPVNLPSDNKDSIVLGLVIPIEK